MRKVGKYLTALRHSRGFGVHSPLAFDLITKVLPDKPRYYGDAKTAQIYSDRRQQRIARVILRLIARFKPTVACASPEYVKAIQVADSRIQFVDNPSEADITVSVSDKKVRIQIGHEQPHGTGPLTLHNDKDLQIVVHRQGLSPTLILTKL